MNPSPPEPPQRAGKTHWFVREVYSHDASLKSYLRGSFPHGVDVDDVVQESYLRIWKARTAQPIRFAKAFLFKVARHVAVDLLRRNRLSPLDPLGDLAVSRVIEERPNAAEAITAQEKLDLLTHAVMALPARCREVIMLHKIKGLPQKEVAARLGLSKRTVENHCRIGVRRCEDYLRTRGINHYYGHDA